MDIPAREDRVLLARRRSGTQTPRRVRRPDANRGAPRQAATSRAAARAGARSDSARVRLLRLVQDAHRHTRGGESRHGEPGEQGALVVTGIGVEVPSSGNAMAPTIW